MNVSFQPALTAISAALGALLLVVTILTFTDSSPGPHPMRAFSAAERHVGLRPMGQPDVSRVIPVLKPAFNATVALLSPENRIVCSGSIIKHKAGESIEVLTAWHCLRRWHPTVVSVGLLYNGEVIQMIVMKKEEGWDLALLHSLHAAQQDGPAVTMADSDPQLGGTIWIIGHPRGILGNITRGVLSNILHVGNGLSYYRIDAPLFYGNSGGGMYNNKGQLVGVADAVEYSRNPDGSSQLVPGGGLCVSLANIRQFVGR